MKTIIDELNALLAGAFAQCGYDEALGNVVLSNRPDLCDYQCDGAFKGAKQYRKAPLAIAQEVAAQLQTQPIFAKIEVAAPGFINLTLSDDKILTYINAMRQEPDMGIPKLQEPETIVLDYGGPNVAKPLHIGHLRSAIIGEAVKRLMRLLGYRVIGDIHLGDWGLQIGLVIAELAERFPQYSCFGESFSQSDALPEITAGGLNEIYPLASQKSKQDAAFSEKAHQYTFDLQQRKPGVLALWKCILKTSVTDLKSNYEKLGVDFDLWYGESDADAYVDEVVAILKNKNLLLQSQGAQIVEVEEETDRAPVPPAIIIKSDGAINYETTDVATILQRKNELSPNKIWYVVDKRQELHFTQVFRVSRRAGIAAADMELLHLGFGTMNGADGKPYKTRDGGVMRLSDMLETVTDAAFEKMKDSSYIAGGSQREVARKIGVAAIKFGDLINHRTKDYIFDLDKFLSFEGKTGTYILYTVTRINSILKKAEQAAEEIAQIPGDSVRGLLLKAMETGSVFLTAAREKAPNLLCENAYQLAVAFSQLYHDFHILTEVDAAKKASLLGVCAFVRKLLLLHLDVLGIDVVEAM